MWSTDATDVSLLVLTRANDYPLTLTQVKAAASRQQLNDAWVNAGALIKLRDGAYKVLIKWLRLATDLSKYVSRQHQARGLARVSRLAQRC